MKLDNSINVDTSFKALADSTRRSILMHLSQQDMTIGEVSSHFQMTRAAVKKHLSILERGQLISVHPNGRERINRIEPLGLKPISDWMNHFDNFWDQRLNALQDAINSEQDNKDV